MLVSQHVPNPHQKPLWRVVDIQTCTNVLRWHNRKKSLLQLLGSTFLPKSSPPPPSSQKKVSYVKSWVLLQTNWVQAGFATGKGLFVFWFLRFESVTCGAGGDHAQAPSSPPSKCFAQCMVTRTEQEVGQSWNGRTIDKCMVGKSRIMWKQMYDTQSTYKSMYKPFWWVECVPVLLHQRLGSLVLFHLAALDQTVNQDMSCWSTKRNTIWIGWPEPEFLSTWEVSTCSKSTGPKYDSMIL